MTTFDNEFDLTSRSLDELILKETNSKDKCVIWDSNNSEIAYSSFLIGKNSQTKTICEVALFKSSETHKYLPRPVFKKIALNGDIKSTKAGDKIIIKLDSSEEAITFWKLIGFLFSYKELVDGHEFEKSYKVLPKDSYVIEFKNKTEKERIEDLKDLFKISDLSTSAIKSITFESRKQNLRAFYFLLKNVIINNTEDSLKKYSAKYSIQGGEEHIWHHFLRSHDWILGLNTDIRFVTDFLDEQKIGNPNSKGSGNPQTDLLGISDFTVLVELKHSNTEIFKKTKSKGRANTWDFTADFIEAISQCLGQKNELEKSYESKVFIKEDLSRLNKIGIHTIDPRAFLIIGNKKKEFPIKDLNDINFIKNDSLERFRRNNRNIDVITYDELFERAYHIVYSKKLPIDWYSLAENDIFPN
ncbi:Shedu anti-phage system protein SduA domain-containing protein [Flavobacterium ardleyense]|uniref:Shedu anti-phage system protein SduA domain-containing protein n=1 Tax=Flavobacterium ardleyense TaxID=2038737 RepID=A0ABW5Z7Q0_9FLAO